jgi:tetratricopeptide (TPR) repeat protein
MRALPLVALAILSTTVLAQDTRPASPDAARQAEFRKLFAQGHSEYEAKNHAKAIELFQAAMEKGMKSPEAPYNIACCQALLGKSDDAFKFLAMAIERGWRNVEHLKSDTDLAGLHADARWPETLKSCETEREKYFQSLKEPELARELLKRRDEDQRLRFAWQNSTRDQKPGEPIKTTDVTRDLERVDRENTAFMKKTLEKHGWPGRSLVGEDASRAAWLLVQHAPDVEFQARCVDLLKEALKKNDANAQDLAYLTDRVLVRQGKKQIYGTQFLGEGRESKPFPIEDEANVDKRRAEIGLQPLAEYAKTIRGE